MKRPWENKVGLAKATAILATWFTISLGLCGLNWAAFQVSDGEAGALSRLFAKGPGGGVFGGLLIITAYLELLGMIVCGAGLIIVGLLYILKLIFQISSTNNGDRSGDSP